MCETPGTRTQQKGRPGHVGNSVLLRRGLSLEGRQLNPNQNPGRMCAENDKPILKFIWKHKG